jgi:hypothetical protein
MDDARFNRWLKVIQASGIGLAGILISTALTINVERNRQNEFEIRILSEREQQDSTMREKMFTALIGSYFGKEGCASDPFSRLQLLHLLVVNFAEFFDAWPLFEDLENELTGEKEKERLHQVANQTVDSQINQLTKSGEPAKELELCFARLPSPETEYCAKPEFTLKTRDGESRFSMELIQPVEPSRIRVRVAAIPPIGDEASRTANTFKAVEFPVSYYSMPFMRYTLLEDGTRFAITLKNLDVKDNHATVRIVTFPEGYMSLRDRPSLDQFYARTQRRYAWTGLSGRRAEVAVVPVEASW